MKKNKNAFTLVELIVAVLIISMVILTGVQLFTMALASKVKIHEQAVLEKNIFYFSEILFSLVKKGGTLDYEEYFNRRLVSTENYVSERNFTLKKVVNGHFAENTGFGNFGFGGTLGTSTDFGEKFYYCSSSGSNIVETGCFKNSAVNLNKKDLTGIGRDYLGHPQRYGQYSFQFIDYNSDGSVDKGDANGDSSILRDDDDKHLGKGPEVFPHNTDIKELYLISGDKKNRTFFRWNIKQDEFVKNNTCNPDPKHNDFKYCRGTIEFLKLEGYDWGMNHDQNKPDEYTNDGIIDTWVISPMFSGESKEIIAGTLSKEEMDKYRKPLFSDDINISDFKVFAYPNIDSTKVWNLRNTLEENKYFISPYVILSFEVKPSNKIKTKIRGDIKPVKFNTTINLTEIFSNGN